MAVLREDIVKLRFEVENDPVVLMGQEMKRMAAAFAPMENSVAGVWERLRASVQGGMGALPVLVVPPPDTAAFMVGLRSLQLAVQVEAIGIAGRMQGMGSGMQAALGSIQLGDVGSDIMRGLLVGILSQKAAIMAAVQGIAQGIRDTIASAMKIASPSKEMAELGRFIGLGLPMGFDQAMPDIREGSERMAEAARAAPAQRAAEPQVQREVQPARGKAPALARPTVVPAWAAEPQALPEVQPVMGRGLVQHNAYAPQFTLNVGSGQAGTEREMERKVRAWVKESFEDVIAAAAQSAPTRREV